MNDNDRYNLALIDQRLRKFLESDPVRHLGLADEICPTCGGPIETLLDSDGKNPMRCCWRCEQNG